MKAGRDLVHDRRQTFELGLLLELCEFVERGENLATSPKVRVQSRLLPASELPALQEWLYWPRMQIFDPRLDEPTAEDADARREYTSTLRERIMADIDQAITRRTR